MTKGFVLKGGYTRVYKMKSKHPCFDIALCLQLRIGYVLTKTFVFSASPLDNHQCL